MYIVEHTVLGVYRTIAWAATEADALAIAEELLQKGWAEVRIRTPDGRTIQVRGW